MGRTDNARLPFQIHHIDTSGARKVIYSRNSERTISLEKAIQDERRVCV